MIKQGAVKIDGSRVEDRALQLTIGQRERLPGRQAEIRSSAPQIEGIQGADQRLSKL